MFHVEPSWRRLRNFNQKGVDNKPEIGYHKIVKGKNPGHKQTKGDKDND